MLKIAFLIQSNEVKDGFLHADLPEGVLRGRVGIYHANGGELYFLSFSAEKSTISNAKKLARLRDMLADEHAKLLVDDVSLKFTTALYPLFAEYERKLRCAITLATCAEHDNFDDKLVGGLEHHSLDSLGKTLFYSNSFQDRVVDRVKNKSRNPFTKEEISNLIARLEEDTIWSSLFNDDEMGLVRKNYTTLQEMRNDVMHHRVVSSGWYDRARSMLRSTIDVLDSYIEHVRSDVSYPKRQAMRAVGAAKILHANLDSMTKGLSATLSQMIDTASIARSLTSQIDASALIEFASQIANAQETMAANREMLASVVKSLGTSFDIAQARAIRDALDSFNQTAIQEIVASESLKSQIGLATFSVEDSVDGLQASDADVDSSETDHLDDSVDGSKSRDSGQKSQ